MGGRRLRVLLCAGDRNLLRHLAKFLGVVGFDVQQAADIRLAEAACAASRPDFLILDDKIAARGGLELCRSLTDDIAAPPVVALLLSKNLAVEEVTAALEAGIDDFLALPVVYGEMLSRLRVGARLIEYEHRERAQAPLDPLTLLPSRGAFVEQLRWTLGSETATDIACVALHVDFFARIAATHGRRAADATLQAFAVRLNDLCPTTAMAACLGEAQFAVLLPNHKQAEAAAWAENARKTLGEADYKLGDAAVQLTTSLGLALGQAGDDADDMLLRASAALTIAERSGHNCVVCDGQHDDTAADAELTHLFDRTTAGDVATPITLSLRHDEPLSVAQTLLAASGLTQVPVVDKHGKLMGVVAADVLTQSTARGARTVRDAMLTEIAELDQTASFEELMSAFSEDGCSLVAVLQSGKPAGFVTRDSLVALSQPIKSDTFAPRIGYSSHSEYLVVSEVATVDEA